jgi:hypothetical protein
MKLSQISCETAQNSSLYMSGDQIRKSPKQEKNRQAKTAAQTHTLSMY